MIAIIYTDGELSVKEVKTECQNQQWVPLLVYRVDGSDTIHLPYFDDQTTLMSFIKRNIPALWTKGCFLMTNEETKLVDALGWKRELFRFPKKLAGAPGIKVGFEILHLTESPDLLYSH